MGMNAGLVVGVIAVALAVRSRTRRRTPAKTVTWDCGYVRSSPRMAYTASSFGQILVGLYGWLLHPRSQETVAKELFPPARSFHTSVPERVIEDVLTPLWAGFRRGLIPFRALQQGRVQQYLVYILLTLCALLASLFPIDRILVRFVGW